VKRGVEMEFEEMEGIEKEVNWKIGYKNMVRN
jgi:hypothetical protein